MKCWYRLNIDAKNAIRPDWKFENTGKTLSVAEVPVDKIFNKEWLDYVKSLGITFLSALVFYRAPYTTPLTAHIDLRKIEKVSISSFAINLVYGGNDSNMVWFKMPEGEPEVKYTESGNPFMDWDCNSLEEIDRAKMNNTPTLVRVGIPHTVEMNREERWCISARTTIKNDLPWDEIVEILRDKKLLIER